MVKSPKEHMKIKLTEMVYQGFFYCPGCERASTPKPGELLPICGRPDCRSRAPLEWREPVLTYDRPTLAAGRAA